MALVPATILVLEGVDLRTEAQAVEAEIVAVREDLETEAERPCCDEEEEPARDYRDELALAVAKVGVNEAGWRMPADVALIYQTTRGRDRRPRTTAERLEWLTRHSSCVLTDRPLREGEERTNCIWTRFLSDSDAEPENFPEIAVWQNYVRRWQQVRTFARQLVEGRSRMRPCSETPYSWGGPMDHARALRLGMRPLNCRDPRTGTPTLNDGFVPVDDPS